MAVTAWNPATVVSRGNMKIGLVPSIVDINKPTVAELTAGTTIDCSITEFTGSSEVDGESIDWLCNPVSETLPGSTTHEIDDLLIKATGQNDDDLYSVLSVGEIIYLYRRDGIPHATEIQADQKLWIWKIQITSVDPAEATNTYVAVNAHVSVIDRTALPVKVVA